LSAKPFSNEIGRAYISKTIAHTKKKRNFTFLSIVWLEHRTLIAELFEFTVITKCKEKRWHKIEIYTRDKGDRFF